MKFSVLMAIYYKENPKYFSQALESIWDIQKVKPDEIVLVEDGDLTKELYDIVNKWSEKLSEKFVVIKLKKNVGFAKALNEGLKFCKYELVARMDTDDIALSNRFEIQINHMDENRKISVCGTYIEEFNENTTKHVAFPTRDEDIKKFIKLRSPICHPSSIIRKNVILEVGGYPELRLGQDYALWSVLVARGYNIINIPQVLLKLRTNSDFFKRRGWESFKYEVAVIKIQYEEGLINIFEVLKAFSLRFMLRLSPVFMKKIAYKILRK